jgi:type II secretory pathway component GspD/PulD (secretin)
MIRALLIASLLLAFAATGTQALASEPETRIIQLKHRDADDVMPVLLPLLERDGRITGRQYQLFVRTSARNFADIERVVQEIDTPQRSLRISVRQSGNRRAAVSEQEVSGERRAGDNTRIILAPSAGHSHNGLVIRREGQEGVMQYRSERHTSVRAQDASQFVTVLEGRRAYIAVGVSLPQVQPFLALAGDRIVVAAGITYRDVSTGFEVLPSIHNDEIDLEITPRLAFVSDQGSQQVAFHELSTHVRVRTGEWVDLGGILSSANHVGRMILGATAGQSEEQVNFQVRVE